MIGLEAQAGHDDITAIALGGELLGLLMVRPYRREIVRLV